MHRNIEWNYWQPQFREIPTDNISRGNWNLISANTDDYGDHFSGTDVPLRVAYTHICHSYISWCIPFMSWLSYANCYICLDFLALDHYDDVIMSAMASLITSLTIAYSTFYSRADQMKHQSSASLAFVWGNHRWPVNSPHKGPVTRKMFPFDDVIMASITLSKPMYHCV